MPSGSRHVLLVSAFTLGAQATLLGSQFVFAATFGASTDSDAFFAAIALPLYTTTVLVSSLAVVFIPVFIEHRARGGEDNASHVATGALNSAALGLGIIAAVGMLFADTLLAWSAPGLPAGARRVAGELAVVLWPSVVLAGLAALLTALWQADSRFGWSAAVPFLCALANLIGIAVLAPLMGIVGAAVAWTASLLLQVLLLAPVVRGRWRPATGFAHPGVRAIFYALAPLVLSSLFIRASTVVERYLGSQLPAGELSHLTYASRIVVSIAVLMTAGPAAVTFLRMATDVAARDLAQLKVRVGGGLHALWLLVAPVVALLVALADPVIRVVLEHGVFTRSDSDAVALLLRVYSASLIPAALGAITGRAIYALGAVRFLAAVGALEGAAYVVYTTYFAHQLGAPGIALGLSVYYVGSLTWQLFYLGTSLRGPAAMIVWSSVATTGALATVAGIVAWLASHTTEMPLASLAIGGLSGATTFVAGLAVTRPDLRSQLLRGWRTP